MERIEIGNYGNKGDDGSLGSQQRLKHSSEQHATTAITRHSTPRLRFQRTWVFLGLCAALLSARLLLPLLGSHKSLADLRPACVVQPVTAAQVAVVVRVLNHRNHTSVRFAVKSGGHDPNPGHASVDGGVLVALRHLEGVRYDVEKGVAYVKPGTSKY
ncbi:hypothetical protein PG997_008246 [Apiospora hydei]|uniref:FAD-binding PCMH-type domain-containing protein n=1 Tax=Apiospora hydei TaxID=1337664 RepID=A0ABR1WAB3_9PEZI